MGMANGRPAVARYTLKHLNRSEDLDLPSFLPLLSRQYLMPGYDEPNLFRQYNCSSTRLWDGSVLLLWVKDHTLFANLLENPGLLTSEAG